MKNRFLVIWVIVFLGVVVDGVKPQSPAEKSGIRQHDVITHINGVPVTSHYQVNENSAGYNCIEYVLIIVMMRFSFCLAFLVSVI